MRSAILLYLGPNLYIMYLEEMQCGSLGIIINKGNEKFIPKNGDPNLFTSWRPIILMNEVI